jgi:hypothetical protein
MKTTKKQFAQFKAECLRLQGVLGLMEWDIYFEHKSLNRDVFATCDWNVEGLACALRFNLDASGTNVGWINPVKTAKHEMTHLLLAKFRYQASCRYIHPEEIDLTVEGLCNVLEKVL